MSVEKKLFILWMLIGMLLIAVESAYPEYGVTPETIIDPEVVRIDEDTYLGTRIDGDYVLLDEEGREFLLSDMFGKPLIILLSYYSCNGICPTANLKLGEALEVVDKYSLSKDYSVLTLSFDRNDSVQSIGEFRKMTGIRKMNGWKMAIMKNGDEIKKFTESMGYNFFWSSRDRMFLHPNTLIFLSPEGRIVRYLYGTPPDAGDIERAIAEAGFGRPGKSGVIDLISMACYSYNYKEGRYTINYPLFIGFGSLILGISSIVFPIIYIRKRKEVGV